MAATREELDKRLDALEAMLPQLIEEIRQSMVMTAISGLRSPARPT